MRSKILIISLFFISLLLMGCIKTENEIMGYWHRYDNSGGKYTLLIKADTIDLKYYSNWSFSEYYLGKSIEKGTYEFRDGYIIFHREYDRWYDRLMHECIEYKIIDEKTMEFDGDIYKQK